MSKAVRKFWLFSEECLHSSGTVWSSAIICEAKDSETSKACELTGLTSPPTGCFLHRHMHSVACVGNRSIFSVCFLQTCCNHYSVNNNYLGCLDFRYLKSFISYMQFSRYIMITKIHLNISLDYQVENTRFELVTSCLQGRRSPNWANPPYSIIIII